MMGIGDLEMKPISQPSQKSCVLYVVFILLNEYGIEHDLPMYEEFDLL